MTNNRNKKRSTVNPPPRLTINRAPESRERRGQTERQLLIIANVMNMFPVPRWLPIKTTQLSWLETLYAFIARLNSPIDRREGDMVVMPGHAIKPNQTYV